MIRIISNYIQAIKIHFNHVYDTAPSAEPLNAKLALVLMAFSGALLCFSAIGYLLYGYHWGFNSINAFSSNLPEAIFHNITVLGDGVFILSLLLLVSYKRPPLLLSILIAAVLGGLCSQILKRLFDAGRPPSILDEGTFNLIGKAYQTHSFPSGHTITAFLTASVLICFSTSLVSRIVIASLAVIAGLSRVFVGVHWPIDVFVGAAIGTMVGLVSFHLSAKYLSKCHRGWIVFTLLLLGVAAISALTKANDYAYAQVLISITAVIALWTAGKFYLAPERDRWSPLNTGRLKHNLELITRNCSVFFYLVLVILTAYRVLVITQEHITLFYDEAYYYHWALSPGLGYYSKPPMVAWFIHLFTNMLGDTVFAIKLAAPLLYSAAAIIIFKTGTYIARKEQALAAGLVFLSAPLVGFNSAFITTDAPLLFFWALSLYLFIRAVHENTLILWLGLGVSTGFGMLSKYTMGILPISLFAFMLLSPTHRNILKSPKPWLAAIIAGLLFSLNLYWNSQNQWIAFLHTQEISQQDKNGINILGFIEFMAAQLFVLGPVWVWLGLKHASKLNLGVRNGMAHVPRLLAFSTLGILLVIGFQALSSRAFPNWAGPWIIGASLLVGLALPLSRGFGKAIRIGFLSNIMLVSAFYHWPYILDYLNIEATKKNTPYQRIEGWEEMGIKLKPILNNNPESYIASDSRDLIAYLGFHAAPGARKFARWNPDANNVRDHYDLKYNFREYIGQNKVFIFVSKTAQSPILLSKFESAEYLGKIEQHVFKDKKHSIYVYRLTGFNGY